MVNNTLGGWRSAYWLVIELCVVIALGLSSQAWARDKPDWVDGPSQDGYYTGVGIVARTRDKVEDRRRAEGLARANLASGILAEVNSSIETQISETRGGGTSTYASSMSQQTSITSSISIPGVAAADRWYDKKRKIYYCYVTVPMEAVAEFQERNYASIEGHINAQRELIERGRAADPLPVRVQRLVDLLDYTRRQYAESFIDVGQRLDLIATARSLESELAALLSRITFSGAEIARLPTRTPVDETCRAVCYLDGMPVRYTPFSVGFVDGKGYGRVQDGGVSDADGAVEFRIYQVNSIIRDNTIAISPDLYRAYPDSLVRLLPSLPEHHLVFASYDPKEDVRCYLATVSGPDYLEMGPLAGRLAGSLGRQGYNTSEMGTLGLPGREDIMRIGDRLPKDSPGTWVIIGSRITDTRSKRGITIWETGTRWLVVNTSNGTSACRSGSESMSFAAATESAVARELHEKLYSKVRGGITDAIRDCSK